MNNKEILEIRKDFDYTDISINNKKIIYLDNAATTQKPKVVINAVSNFYKNSNANPHRGAHYLSIAATNIYDEARNMVAKFINAEYDYEVIFTKGTTESINLVAYSYGVNNLKTGDEILISILEHHSNLCTWQMVCEKTGAKLSYIYIDENMQIDIEDFKSKLNKNVKLVAITGASNTVGTCPDIKKIIELSKKNNSIVLIDAAQLAPHETIDVQYLDCDFLVFSGHKMCANMGIGVLYGKRDILEKMTPYHYGGDMIEYVYEQKSTYAPLPYKFEAGTQNVSGALSLMEAIKYLNNIGFEKIAQYEKKLTNYAFNRLKEIPWVDLYTTKNEKRSPIVLFNVIGVHPHDVSTILDADNVAIRSGHHCAAPLHSYMGLNSTCRASFTFYNTFDEVDIFLNSLENVKEVFKLGY